MKHLFILGLLLVTKAQLGYGQTTCQKEKVYGIWKSIGSEWGRISNLDSLKSAIIHTDSVNTWDFHQDGTYSHTYQDQSLKKPYIRKGTFTLDEMTCEIFLGTQRKSRKKANLEVLYVDEHYLITANKTPKGYYSHFLSR